MKILFLEPFYGGSHRDFAEGLISHSRHHYNLHTLPQRFWKWRMRGAALYFSHKIKDPGKYDLLLISDLMSLSDLKSLWVQTCPPSVVYFHESQLSYPELLPGEYHDCSLYDDEEQLYRKLKNLLTAGIPDTRALSRSFDRYFEEIAKK